VACAAPPPPNPQHASCCHKCRTARTQGQPLDGEGGAGGGFLREVLAVHRVHGSKVGHVGLWVGGQGRRKGGEMIGTQRAYRFPDATT
jgi:hypothetical protein